MKSTILRTCFTLLVFLLLSTKHAISQPHGRVVINEYMSWTSAGCGTTAEFVELLNFGPGPIDISCYILTTGVYSVTIPANTILKPREYYVLGGQNFIPGTCANIDSAATGISVKLNWNTCNCTNIPIPTTGDGMLKDGGSSNTPLVLLDPSLNIVDAVVRNIPTEPVGTVTSASTTGCTGRTFNIGTMNPNYEILGMAGGRGNSYARTLDGDCNWVKETQQSGNATNNRSGRTTDISYDLDMVMPTSCEDAPTGSVSIYVKHADYSTIFPMFYTIVVDSDKNGEFDFSDKYETYYDNDPPFIEIDNLPIGRFRVVVGSVKGCYLQSFDFSIVSCNPGTLPVRLEYFKKAGSLPGKHNLEWLLHDVQNMQSIILEKSADGAKFITEKIFTNEQFRGTKVFSYAAPASSGFQYYRLKIMQKSGRPFYSQVINTASGAPVPLVRIGPNPATDKLDLQLASTGSQNVSYTIYNSNGQAAKQGHLPLAGSATTASISLHTLLPGTYQLQITGIAGQVQPFSFRFVKH